MTQLCFSRERFLACKLLILGIHSHTALFRQCAVASSTIMASEAYGGGAAAAPEGSAPAKDSRNSLYSFDEQKLELLRKTKPWTNDPKYFKKVKISPSAAMKMVRETHRSDTSLLHVLQRY